MHVFVTGATSGIGRATAEAFAREGASLTLAARRTDRLEEISGRLRKEHGVEVVPIPLDVRDRAMVDARAEEHAKRFTTVDILVNNAGLARGLGPIHGGEPDHWEEMIDTNVKGLLYVTRRIAPGMVERRKGHIVNLGSIAGRWVYPNGVVYCATKFAVRALTEGLRVDLHGTGVRVTTVDPGLVETEFSLVRFDGDAAKAKVPYAGMTPLAGADVADAIVWAATRPAHVNVSEIVLFPTDQSAIGMVNRRT
jgi:NADP-dependent 3-hydroxy acid dehydrogenase YdfG